MDENDEILVYDAMAAIQKQAATLCELINRVGTDAEKKAYKEGVYVPCIKLQAALGEEAMNRGKARHERIDKEAKEFFATQCSGKCLEKREKL